MTLDPDSHAGGTPREHEGRDGLMHLQAQEPQIAGHHRGGAGSDMGSPPGLRRNQPCGHLMLTSSLQNWPWGSWVFVGNPTNARCPWPQKTPCSVRDPHEGEGSPTGVGVAGRASRASCLLPGRQGLCTVLLAEALSGLATGGGPQRTPRE